MTATGKLPTGEEPTEAGTDPGHSDRAPSPADRAPIRFTNEEKQLARLCQQVEALTEEVSNTRIQVQSHHDRLRHLGDGLLRLNTATQGLHDLVTETWKRLEMLWSSKPWRIYSRLRSKQPSSVEESAVVSAIDSQTKEPPPDTPVTPIAEPLPSAVDLYLPYKSAASSYLVPRVPPEAEISEVDGLPLPPADLMLGHPDAERYISWGQEHVGNMRRLLEETGFEFSPGLRVLDFGCGSGRLLRHFAPLASEGGYWGVDIRSEHILWCKQNLSPPFQFAVTTIVPHLPFEDRSFDLIYAGSVFTHIDDLADAWFLELKRILKPGASLYFTIHDHHSVDRLMDEPSDNPARQVPLAHDSFEDYVNADYSMFTLWRSAESQVFYDLDCLLTRLGPLFDVITHRQEAYGLQTGIIVRRPT